MNAINITKNRHAKNTTFAKMLALIMVCAISTSAMGTEKMFRDGQLYYLLDEQSQTAEVISPRFYFAPHDDYFNQNEAELKEEHKRVIQLQIPSQIKYGDITYSVIRIGHEAFKDSPYLTSVTLPEGIISIDELAFGYCERLTTVTLPSTIRQIGHGAFCHCYNLTNVICLAERIPCLGNCIDDEFDLYAVFYKDSYELQDTLYVPQKRLKKYKHANEWGRFKVILPISELKK